MSVLCYDYSGYGLSSGKPSEENVYSDILAAYTYLVGQRRICPKSIVLFGQSLGSGPTVHLAVRLGPNLGGVVLISPIKSCIRVKYDTGKTHRFDMFANVDKIALVQVPVFCVHARDDEIVPFSHGVALHQLAKYALDPYWLNTGGHNEIESGSNRPKVFASYASVLEQLKVWTPPSVSTKEGIPSSATSSRRKSFLRKTNLFWRFPRRSQ